ncbi:unnamed protein product [Symbiodinium pilosum]|uniref:Uncharacterized protein n=1 Tax=Symbiodinium pilosum TaxID=2952 RepID=A0A812MMV8_SYMPI|nr:unnamed protein product [Symbiodinium pilosum]
MYHRWGNSVGCVPRKIQPQLHQRRADALEPSKYIERKKSLVEEMLAEVEQIDERDKSNVPEQYDLVNKTPGWRHVTVSWICEVNLFQYMDTHGRGLRIAFAEAEWLSAVKKLKKSRIFNAKQTCGNLYDHLDFLSDKAEKWWMDLAVTCRKC